MEFPDYQYAHVWKAVTQYQGVEDTQQIGKRRETQDTPECAERNESNQIKKDEHQTQ